MIALGAVLAIIGVLIALWRFGNSQFVSHGSVAGALLFLLGMLVMLAGCFGPF